MPAAKRKKAKKKPKVTDSFMLRLGRRIGVGLAKRSKKKKKK